MVRRGLNLCSSLLTSSHSFHSTCFFPHSFRLCRPQMLPRLICTCPPDNLDGLIDHEFDFAPNSTQDFKVQLGLDQELAILRESTLEGFSDKTTVDSSKFSNDACLISNAIRNNNDGFGEKTQKFLRQFREKLGESLVVDVLRNVQNAELGVKFFIWAGRQIGYSHTLAVYNALLDVLGCDNGSREAEQFLKEIKDDDENVMGKLLNVLIHKFCRNGSWNVALQELGRLKDLGYKPSMATYNALVRVFLEADKLDTASLVHGEMVDMGYRMDAHTLGCYASLLCKNGRWMEALDLLEKEDFSPDTILYTRMISGLCEGSYFEEAMEFLTRMRSNSCIPNVVTYRTLLCWCLNKKKLGRCKMILSMMITEGCYPSSRIFNSLVHSYCKSGDYSYAYKLLGKMAVCGCQPGYLVYNILIGGICGNEESPTSEALSLAEKAYSEMLDAGVVLNKVNVSNFARCLCGAGKFEKAYNIIHEMMSKGFSPDVSTYSKVISFLCNATKVEKAFLLFKQMKDNGIVPNVYTYTILIDSFCKAGLIQQAHSWFNDMVKDGCAPNVVTYTALIHAFLKARKVSDANELFELMLAEGCIPNVVTLSALIDGHCKAGEIEKAYQIYAKMRGKEVPDVMMYFKGEDNKATEPNVFTYGALVDGLCKVHRVEQAHELLDAMSVEGCEPNHIVYDALIDGFCKVGKLDEAHTIVAKMYELGYIPNVFTYGSFIDRLFKEKRLDVALRVLSQMLENSCPPNVIIYTQMIDGLCKVGKTDEAFRLMLMMEEKGCNPNAVTYTAMIDGFGKANRVEKCLELFEQMCAKSCAPNYVTYRVLINHCIAAGLLDEAHQFLEEMKLTYWPTHMASYRKVIEGFNREFIVNLGLLEEIGEYESAPIVPVYRILIDSFHKVGRFEVALELHKEIRSSLIFTSSDKSMYCSLIENLCRSNNVDKALELYMDMIEKGVVPELSVFFNLIKGLISLNKWEEALQLSHCVCCMCTEEAHRPVDCDTVAKWILKNSAESENMNWILANSKPCPKCKQPIEKNQGCMHMTCTLPYKFEFCWLCCGAWSDHGERTGGFYACNRYEAAKQEGAYDEAERRREMARNSLERYTHYYERWATNQSSRQKALADLYQMQNVLLRKLSEKQCQPETQLKFIIEAWLLIVECRRALKWTYAYGYYLPEQKQAKRQFFEYLQGEGEAGLERLHKCAEKELHTFQVESAPEAFNNFRTKLAGLISVTRNYFENLVRALENGLSDVDSQVTSSRNASSKSGAGTSKGKVGKGKGSARPGGSNKNSEDSSQWACDQCTYVNSSSSTSCQICTTPR